MQKVNCSDSVFFDNHEILVEEDLDDGFCALIAIHNNKLGPAYGGTRIMEYESKQQAIDDVLRLSIGMSYKNCAAGIAAGGGKAVIIKPKGKEIKEGHLQKYADFINKFEGSYITTEDVGMNQQYLHYIQKHTQYAVGSKFQTYIYTADLLVNSLTQFVLHKYGKDISDFSITIQGIGKVGKRIVEKLIALKCPMINICDVDNSTLEQIAALDPNIQIISNDFIHNKADIFIPSAIGGIIHEGNIDQLKYQLICGPANNILLHPQQDAVMLANAGILYIPDYLVNSGGIVAAYIEFLGKEEEDIYTIINKIPPKLLQIFDDTDDNNIWKILNQHCSNTLGGIN